MSILTAKQALQISNSLESRNQDSALNLCAERIIETAGSGKTQTRIEMASEDLRIFCVAKLKDLGYNSLDTGNEILISWE